MSAITVIKEVKKIHKEEVLLVKIGDFYHCFGRDSYIISYLFNYKLRKTKENYYTCGFPEQSLAKIESKLENKKISYIILDKRNNYRVDTYQNYRNLNNYKKIYEKSKRYTNIKSEIDEIYNKLKNSINSDDIYEKIKGINEILKE